MSADRPARSTVTARAFALVLALAAASASAGCHRHVVATRGPHASYLRDRASRRAALEASLLKPYGRYAEERLAHYATPGDASWERLTAWNPEVAPLIERDGASGANGPNGEPDAFARLAITPAAARGDANALRALGARAFARYPAQTAPFDAAKLSVADRRARGLWLGPAGELAGLVRVRYADGSTGTALTCATCHARTGSNGTIVLGASNDALDFGRLVVEAPPFEPLTRDDAREARFLAWGPGRVDVTTADGSEPLHVPDLRAVRFERHLQQSGAVIQRDVTSLAVRLETLIVTSHDGAIRPPREVAIGLALYLWSLGDALPAPPPAERNGRGALVFEKACGKCHEGDALAGGLVPASKIGTDPAAARSPDRGTGAYRITSLRGLGSRRTLMHDASVRGVDDLLDPARLRETPPRAGHRYGLDLAPHDRAALTQWLLRL
jgi:hypothetical protein